MSDTVFENPRADSDELAWTPAWRLGELFASRKLSPVEYAEHLLARVERHRELGAFITVFPEALLAEARAAEQAVMRGGELPLLHGIPVSIKDTLWTKGQRTTHGSKLYADFLPGEDAVSVERIRKAGGIVFAKANTPEFAMNRRSVNLVSREAVNPWDRKRSSGGSSGGSGVATAAGLGPMSVGTDGGGSIRIPSSFNGVFGLYPTRGLTPDGYGDWDAPTSGLGPMTRDVRDAAMLLAVMAGPDKRDYFSTKAPSPSDYLGQFDQGIRDVRVAWSGDLGRIEPAYPEVVDICHDAARAFRAAGARYSEPSLSIWDPFDFLDPAPEYTVEALGEELRQANGKFSDVFTWMRALPPEKQQLLSIYIRDRSDRPTMLDYTMGISPEVRSRARDRLVDIFERYDLLVCPVIDRPAFIASEPGITPPIYTRYTFFVNVAGYCGASVPAGFHHGLPVGLQIIGRPGDEALVLRAARALEKERPWAQNRPPL